jgi:hypothetical protein
MPFPPRASTQGPVKGSTAMNAKPVLLASLVALISSPALAGTAPKNKPSEKIYCIQYEKETGSRIGRQDCLTKKQWEQQGVNVDDLLKK